MLARHAAGGALEVIVIVAGCVTAAAVIAGAAVLMHRARRSDRPGRPITGPAVVQMPRERPAAVEASQPRPAIEPPRNELHLHFHGVSAAEVAEAIRQASE